MTQSASKLKQQTIADFGEQWVTYQDNESFYGSQELFADMLGPLLPFSEVAGKQVIDIGSGTGRIVMMLLGAGAAHVTAVEPSAAYSVLQKNIAPHSARVTLLNCAGDEIPSHIQADYAFSIGVLHHIPDPDAVVQAVQRS